MARTPTGRPTDQELEILKVLWDRGPSSVREVWQTLAATREIGPTSVLKIMQIMRDKGLVVCDATQRPQRYRPKQTQRATLRQLAGDLLARAFGGSTRLLLLSALDKKRCKPEELAEIRELIEKWSKAVRDQNRAEIRKDHDAEILMFDVPQPLQSRGIEEYMATWELFLSSVERPVAFKFTEVAVTAGTDVAFATAIGHCVNIDKVGQREPLTFRLTMGLRKMAGRWIITHEHHSLPSE